MKKKIIATSLKLKNSKPDTVMRAGITANTKYTRGKQLVEHDPLHLIPDPYNPRPGDKIDDTWIRYNLKIDTKESLCRSDPTTGEYIIPSFSEVCTSDNDELEDSYNFLRDLAYSIRNDGLIEPIEIFLADKENDPDYFLNSEKQYGYVILEGHQRRLAAIMAGVPNVTCIEITDESLLAKLKVKHRKLRRQLSENNLRKGLTVAQNFLIVQNLLLDDETIDLSNKELSSIIGLNEAIASALKIICLKPEKFPPIFFSKLNANQLSFKTIRMLVPKTYAEIENILNGGEPVKSKPEHKPQPRGRQGGAKKKYATFKVSDERETSVLYKVLLSRFPEIDDVNKEITFKSLEDLLYKVKELALNEKL
ncbi:chromosome partitioning protein ParB [Legionella quinlivanii]|uniref:Chromosome partitioning protein ParB n=1 Tax=Legionella quinlivanii TaxID=45073 RepID=A0A364LFM9_9GAMM|nr:ParB/RepB/Spo0J family partition protein [Legionella quinlivanii]RAP34873.1 chromosome partitioning protein ParB [Legionella quinlivanii]